MQRVLSTYRFVNQSLGPSLLGEIANAGFKHVEIFCDPVHFNYRTPEGVRQVADALGEHRLEVHALHSPTERGFSAGRESGAPISISDTERIRRLDAVDEVKRALDVVERIPFRFLVQHLGQGRQSADPRKLDAAFSSLEHLTVFAKARGVTIAVENTPDELGAPASIHQFIAETHLHDLRVCFDIGHAHLEGGVNPGAEMLRLHIVTTHIHDNHGEKDEHLLPYAGTIDWDAGLGALAGAAQPLPFVFELKEAGATGPSLGQIREACDKVEKAFETKRPRAAKP
jgi:sugar phosphate isomerase/epimerase